MNHLSPDELTTFWKEGGNIVDTRNPEAFSRGFLPGSFYFFAGRLFSLQLKSFLDISQPFVLVVDDKSLQSVEEFAESGTLKYLRGIAFFEEKNNSGHPVTLDLVIDVTPEEFGMDLKYDEKALAVDLRNEEKYQDEHIQNSMSLPLMELADIVQIANLDNNKNLYFYSDTDHDAMTAASIFKRHGLHQIRVVTGGWHQIKTNRLIRTEKSGITKN
jgi:rhodanese-related sulfurtransferase